MRLNGTSEVIDSQEYPVSTEQLIDAHGDHEIETVAGTETLAETLSRIDSEIFNTPDDVRLTVYSAVSGEAVGRRHYSDRDPTPFGSPNGPEQVSF